MPARLCRNASRHPMRVIRRCSELRQHLAQFDRPAFVPTMGNLHLSLIYI